MKKKLKIVVAGYAVGFPLGGQMWMIMHYLLGLHRLGHEVLFLEDTGNWAMPFDPTRGHYHPDSSFGRATLERLFADYGLGKKWSYNSMFEGKRYGMGEADVAAYCAAADLFVNVSGIFPLREEYLGASVMALVDTNPVATQIKVARDDWTREYFSVHDVFFTYGHNIPGGKTKAPLCGIEWNRLAPPIVLSEWANTATPGACYTTVGSWDPGVKEVVLDGEVYGGSRAKKYDAVLDLPSRVDRAGFELCFSGMKQDAPWLESHGWKIKNALVQSRDPWVYRDYVFSSRGEFTVTNDQNVKLKSGWFSDRSATYLASGRPVVNEDSGFGQYLPLGEGLFAFNDPGELPEIFAAIESDYARHARAARRLAEENFDSGKVLAGLLSACGL
jgi:hypothetical protein